MLGWPLFRKSLLRRLLAAGLTLGWIFVAGRLARAEAPPRQTILLLPADRCGLFRQADEIRVETPGNGPVRITTWRGETVFDGKPAALHLPCGHYFVEANERRTQFAVLPDDYHGAAFLGTEAPSLGSRQVQQRVAQINPAYVRTMDEGTYWSDIQPGRNHWDWTTADKVIALNAGRKIIYQAFVRPPWVSDKELIPCFAQFVNAVAARYGSKLYAIEIWNEPTFRGDPSFKLPAGNFEEVVDFYTRLVRACDEAVRRASPTTKLLGPAWYGPGFNAETRRLAEAGVFKLLDGFSLHDYLGGLMAPDAPGSIWLDSWHLARNIEAQMDLYRGFTGNMPLYVDELGLYGASALGFKDDPATDRLFRSDLSWQRGMYRAAKIVAIYRSFNAVLIPHVLIFSGGTERPPIQLQGWERDDSGPHPKTSAFLMTCHWLNGAHFIGKRLVAGRAFLYGWQRSSGSPLVIAWAEEDQSAAIGLPAAITATDLFGQRIHPKTLTEEPILLGSTGSISTEALLDEVATTIKTN